MLLTIVTPCLNRAQYIEEAIQSVLNQDYLEVEHIVVDGGSTDGTLEILSRYEHLKVISEPDQGLYDGLNKGILLSKGDVIGHLNSDDLYAENVFGEIMRLFESDPELEGVFGGAIVFEEFEDGSRKTIAEYCSDDLTRLSLDNITLGNPIINARFFRRSVHDRVGLYETKYKIAADREFLLRVALGNIKWASVNRVVYLYRQHSGSLTFNPKSPFVIRRYEEYVDIAERYLEGSVPCNELATKCLLWHTRETMEGALRTIKRRDIGKAMEYASRGCKYKQSWPALFFWYLLLKSVRKILRGLETVSSSAGSKRNNPNL